MKKIIAFIIVAALIGCMSIAFAAEPITVKITPVDYQTGKVVSKSYVENELFRLRVDIEIPRFVDLENMQIVVEVDGVEVVQPSISLASGTYYIDGIVRTQPASIAVKIKDMAFENAETAEEMYYAMQNDRTVSATYKFYGASVQQDYIGIPKTGDVSVIYSAVACVGAAAMILRKKR